MERLTERSLDYCTQHCPSEKMITCAFYKDDQAERCLIANMYDRLAAYEDTGLEPEEVKEVTSWSYGPFHKKMGDWLKAEQEGRLVVLPCKVGDRVWGIEFDTSECPHCFGFGGCFGCSGAKPKGVYYFKFRLADADKIGKTVFLSRAEAEKAMEVSG